MVWQTVRGVVKLLRMEERVDERHGSMEPKLGIVDGPKGSSARCVRLGPVRREDVAEWVVTRRLGRLRKAGKAVVYCSEFM